MLEQFWLEVNGAARAQQVVAHLSSDSHVAMDAVLAAGSAHAQPAIIAE